MKHIPVTVASARLHCPVCRGEGRVWFRLLAEPAAQTSPCPMCFYGVPVIHPRSLTDERRSA